MPKLEPKLKPVGNLESLIAPRDLAKKLSVSPSTAYRLARRAGLSRVCLSDTGRGNVRYRLSEVVAFIQSRTVKGGK